MDSITIAAWSSPEGPVVLNASLAEKRAASFEALIMKVSDGSLDRVKIRILTDMTIGDETRKWRLKQLDGGC